jgi:hypothetical protein
VLVGATGRGRWPGKTGRRGSGSPSRSGTGSTATPSPPAPLLLCSSWILLSLSCVFVRVGQDTAAAAGFPHDFPRRDLTTAAPPSPAPSLGVADLSSVVEAAGGGVPTMINVEGAVRPHRSLAVLQGFLPPWPIAAKVGHPLLPTATAPAPNGGRRCFQRRASGI